jgi:hypothetical protein
MRRAAALLKRSSGLACSFCRKPDTALARLIGGPGVYICDECVGICNRILDATPAAFEGFEAMSDEELLKALKPANAAVEGARAVLQDGVEVLRKRDVSWAAIGEALGISRQAAWERFS